MVGAGGVVGRDPGGGAGVGGEGGVGASRGGEELCGGERDRCWQWGWKTLWSRWHVLGTLEDE